MCKLPDDPLWGNFKNSTRLLAVITPCVTQGKDATEELVFYSKTTTQIVTDLQTISGVVGRAKKRGMWGIIDRSNSMVHPVFVEEGINIDGNEDEDEE